MDSIKSKKLQNETNKRRRIASAKARAQEEAEEKRRQAILAQRRAELEEATARFQRGHRTYKLLQQRRHVSTERLCSPPHLEEALKAIGTSPRNHNNTEIISQVKLASNSLRNTRNSKTLFEQQLEKHQQILQQQQQEQLFKFNSAIWKEINGDSKVCGVEDIEIDNNEDLNSSSSSLATIDSLERPTSSLAVKHSSLLNSTNVAVVTPNNHTTPPQSQDGDSLPQPEQHSPTYRQVVKELSFAAENDDVKKESQVESINVQHKDINNSPLTAIQNSNKINTVESIVNDRPQDIQVRVAEVKMKPNSEVVHLKHEEQSKSTPESQGNKVTHHSLQSYPPNKYGARPLPQPPPCSEPPNNSPVEDKEDVDSVAEEIFPSSKRRAQSATVRRQTKEETTDPPLKGILKKRPVQSAPLGKRGTSRGSTVKDSLEIIRGRGIENLDYKQNKRNVHFATVLCEEAEFNEHLSTITRLTGSNSASRADKENNNIHHSSNQQRNPSNHHNSNGNNNNNFNFDNRQESYGPNGNQNTHRSTKIPKSTSTSLRPKPPQGPPPAANIRRRIISANSTIPSATNNHESNKHSKPTRVQSAPPRTSVQGLYKASKLERTPTDDEINWLWDRVRTCLQQKPEEAPKVSQRVVDGSSLMKAGTVQRISSARNPLQTQSTINRRKVNMEMLSAYSRKQPGGNIIVQDRPNQFVPKCTSNVTESMAGFLAAEALTEQHHSVTESQLENALEQAKKQQFVHNQQRGTTPTSLSVEEQKLRQSLERLDEKLKSKFLKK